MNAFKRIAIVYNPNSTGPSKIAAKWLERGLKRRLPETAVDLIATEYAGHAETIAYDYAVLYPDSLVVSSSGDGGYHEVVNGVMKANSEGAEASCAVLPAGNANDHRRAVRERPLLKAIVKGDVTEIDLLKATVILNNQQTVRFPHSYIGFGLTPEVAVELNRHDLNWIKESWIALKAFYKLRPFYAVVDGHEQRFDSIVCANIPRMAKFLKVAPKANMQDGLFEVIAFPANAKIKLVMTLLRAATIGMKHDRVENKFELQTVSAMPMQLDGEVHELKRGQSIIITSAPKALKTIL